MFGKNTVLKPIWDMPPSGHPEDHALIEGKQLVINSIFPTIQGEGPHSGEPAIFIRLTGCNLRCHFCDTEFEKGEVLTIDEITGRVCALISAKEISTDLVVLTGGEPMRQQIIPLLARLDDMGFTTQIETAGTVWPPETEVAEFDTHGRYTGKLWRRSLGDLCSSGAVELVCSPKTPKVHAEVEKWCEHFKYIIRAGETGDDGLPNRSTQIEGQAAKLYRPDPGNVIPTIWVQPCAEYAPADPALGDAQFRHTNDPRTKMNMAAVTAIAMKHGYRVSLQQHKILGID